MGALSLGERRGRKTVAQTALQLQPAVEGQRGTGQHAALTFGGRPDRGTSGQWLFSSLELVPNRQSPVTQIDPLKIFVIADVWL